MVSLIQFLDQLSRIGQTALVSTGEVERLVRRFGPQVRGIGFWNKSGDGSVEVPVANVAQAARLLGDSVLTHAVEQLKLEQQKSPEEFSDLLQQSQDAARLMEILAQLHLEQFERRVERFQNSADSAEVDRLRQDISRELFGD